MFTGSVPYGICFQCRYILCQGIVLFYGFLLNYTNTANIVANGRYAVKYAEIYGQYMPSDGGGLTVECQDAYPCPETKVYCPVGETSSCTIDCPDPSSCYNLYAFINNGMYS
eukprot:1022773_1